MWREKRSVTLVTLSKTRPGPTNCSSFAVWSTSVSCGFMQSKLRNPRSVLANPLDSLECINPHPNDLNNLINLSSSLPPARQIEINLSITGAIAPSICFCFATPSVIRSANKTACCAPANSPCTDLNKYSTISTNVIDRISIPSGRFLRIEAPILAATLLNIHKMRSSHKGL